MGAEICSLQKRSGAIRRKARLRQAKPQPGTPKEKTVNKQTNQDEKETTTAPEIELRLEEMEEVIAPGRKFNYNETLARDAEEIELDVEELEEVIAPGKRMKPQRDTRSRCRGDRTRSNSRLDKAETNKPAAASGTMNARAPHIGAL